MAYMPGTQPVHAVAEEQVVVPQVAAEKSKGSLSNAIELLRKYIDTYMLDRAAWEELGDLYLQVWHKTYKCPNICIAMQRSGVPAVHFDVSFAAI